MGLRYAYPKLLIGTTNPDDARMGVAPAADAMLDGVTRGGPERRTKLVAIRLTPDEWAAWEERRAASGRREMAAWVRAVVTDSQRIPSRIARGRRAGDVPVVPPVNQEVREQLARVGSNLNQLVRAVNTSGLSPAVVEDLRVAVGEVQAAVRRVLGRSGE